MLDQLVSFCGDAITEENVLDVFGFTSREKVAALTSALLSRDPPAALALIQKEAESGRELAQLLGELIGCLRALLVAKLDPAADGEGIPAELWQNLLVAAHDYPPERILAAIDVFAETEGRMKWASNKRLHFELGVIKCIQSLDEVRITDVLKVLTQGADFLVSDPVAGGAAPQPPVPDRSENGPGLSVVPAAPVRPKSPGAGHAAFDSLIEATPAVHESAPAAGPPPWKEARESAPPATRQPAEDPFHHDPLIRTALEKFAGKVV